MPNTIIQAQKTTITPITANSAVIFDDVVF